MTDDREQMTEDGRRRFPCCRLSSVVCPLLPAVCYLFLAVLLIVHAGCGRKSPPFVPQERDVTAKVAQLEGVWEEKSLILKGLVQGDAGALSQITGCRVYYVWYPVKQPPCEGCPITMTNFRDVTDRIIGDGKFVCRLPAFKQKGICFVTVRIMEKAGRLGPESGRIKLISKR